MFGEVNEEEMVCKASQVKWWAIIIIWKGCGTYIYVLWCDVFVDEPMCLVD